MSASEIGNIVRPGGDRPYGERELAFDRAIHWLGIGAGAVGAVALLVVFVSDHGSRGLIAVLLYAVGLMAMLCCSAAYNLSSPSPRQEWLRRLDHAAIFLMIAGTYTPFTVLRLAGGWSILLTAVVWSVALAGAAAKLAFPRRLEGASVVVYLALGWIGIIAARPIAAALDPAALVLLAAGGLLYTVGTAFHLWRSLPFQNAIWHACVLSAAGCHYAAVLLSAAF
ncbi:MAG TPA: hemolysin III family protein [Candidatus Udaeobacter sp.]|nr:hemolysin III family protein [Candidatus Udaeobacter sp.]